jgi:hypothetical protein
MWLFKDVIKLFEFRLSSQINDGTEKGIEEYPDALKKIGKIAEKLSLWQIQDSCAEDDDAGDKSERRVSYTFMKENTIRVGIFFLLRMEPAQRGNLAPREIVDQGRDSLISNSFFNQNIYKLYLPK